MRISDWSSDVCSSDLSLVLSGWMVGLGGYELAFLVTAIGPVLGAAVAWLALRSTPNVVHAHQRETGLIREMIRNRPAVRLTVGYTFHSWELLGMWAWVPAFLVAALAASESGDRKRPRLKSSH